jgi:uncharacterized protein
MHTLGTLLYDRGELGEAEQWWRKAAAAGNTDVLPLLANLLKNQGKGGEAWRWRRKAIVAEWGQSSSTGSSNGAGAT